MSPIPSSPRHRRYEAAYRCAACSDGWTTGGHHQVRQVRRHRCAAKTRRDLDRPGHTCEREREEGEREGGERRGRGVIEMFNMSWARCDIILQCSARTFHLRPPNDPIDQMLAFHRTLHVCRSRSSFACPAPSNDSILAYRHKKEPVTAISSAAGPLVQAMKDLPCHVSLGRTLLAPCDVFAPLFGGAAWVCTGPFGQSCWTNGLRHPKGLIEPFDGHVFKSTTLELLGN